MWAKCVVVWWYLVVGAEGLIEDPLVVAVGPPHGPTHLTTHTHTKTVRALPPGSVSVWLVSVLRLTPMARFL